MSQNDRWSVDIKLLHESVDKLFNNDFEGAEEMLKKGFSADYKAISADDHDIRGSFAMVYALVAVMRGVASFSDDSFKICLERLTAADSLASRSKNWPGKKVTRGICTIAVGVLQLLQHKYVQGIYNILKSWSWIKSLKSEALEYDGKEREVVRSAALFTLGAFYLLLGLLPKTQMKVASWVSGFTASREEGIKMIHTCFLEKGLLAPWAALTLLAYHVDTKTFLGEKLTVTEVRLVESVIDWTKENYPNSVFYSGLVADYIAVSERNVEKSRLEQEKEAKEMEKLPALKWVLNYKRGMYALCDMKWFEAATFFRESMQVYIDANRRSMVPFMSAYSLLCYKQAEVEGAVNAQDNVQEMLDLLKKYKEMPKKDWGRQDEYGFEVYKVYCEEEAGKKKKKKVKKATTWPLLALIEIMVLYIRVSWWMNEAQLQAVFDKLEKESADYKKAGAAEHLRVGMCQIELLKQLGKPKEAVALGEDVLKKYEGSMSKVEKRFGAAPMVHFMMAQIYHEMEDLHQSRKCIHEMKKYGTKYELHELLTLKMVVLLQNVEQDMDSFEKIDIPAGQSETLVVEVNEKTIEAPFLHWFWLIKKHTVSLTVTFCPDKEGSEPILLQSFDRKEAAEEASVGEFEVEKYGSGKLVFCFDNSFSMLRGKTIHFRLSPSIEYTR